MDPAIDSLSPMCHSGVLSGMNVLHGRNMCLGSKNGAITAVYSGTSNCGEDTKLFLPI